MAESQAQTGASEEVQTKMSPEEFNSKLNDPEFIKTIGDDPQKYINDNVQLEQKSEPVQGPKQPESEFKQPEPEPAPEPQPNPEPLPKPEPVEQKDGSIKFQTFGEALKYAKDEYGEKFENIHDVLKTAKSRKERAEEATKALERWKNDAVTKASEVEKLQKTIEDLKKNVPTSQPEKQDDFSLKVPDIDDEPEIPKPNEYASEDERDRYYAQVIARNKRVSDKKMNAMLELVEKKIQDQASSHKQEVDKLLEQSRQMEESVKEKDKAAKALEETFVAADDFIRKNQELAFSDGKNVEQKNEEYVRWQNDLDYIKRQNSAYEGRNLAQEYINGDPGVTQLVNSYGVREPADLKKFALLLDLDNLVHVHNLTTNAGRPDYDAAYALKKRKDGVDVDEINQARSEGATEVLDVIQERQAAPPQIGGSDAAQPPPAKVTPQQLEEKLALYKKEAQAMSVSDRSKLWAEIETDMKSLGLEVEKPK